MKRIIVGVVFVLFGLALACAGKRDKALPSTPSAPKLTPEYLLAHGFKQSPTDRHLYVLKHVRLGDALRDLGLAHEALEGMMNVDADHVRAAEVQGLSVVVQTELRHTKDGYVMDSLDDLDAICKVAVLAAEEEPARKYPARKLLKTDSSPRMRIKSVTLPKDGSKPLEIGFELAAEGKTPLVVSEGTFAILFTTQGPSPRHLVVQADPLPKKTPDRISVSPGKPIMLTLRTSRNPVTGGPWSDLPPGEYVLCLAIGTGKRQSPSFDYEWVGVKHSDDYKVVIK